MNNINCNFYSSYESAQSNRNSIGFGNGLLKRAERFLTGNKNVTGQDAQIILGHLGYELRTKSSGTSHRIFTKEGMPCITLTQRNMNSKMINNQSPQIKQAIKTAGGLSVFA